MEFDFAIGEVAITKNVLRLTLHPAHVDDIDARECILDDLGPLSHLLWVDVKWLEVTDTN